MKGRKPRLYAVEDARGDVSHRPPKRIAHAAGDFDPPGELGPLARAEWDRIRAEAPWIRAASAALLYARCVTFEDWMNVRRQIAEAADPDWRLHQRERDAKTYLIRADAELCLTAASSTKVSAPAQGPVDASEEAIA